MDEQKANTSDVKDIVRKEVRRQLSKREERKQREHIEKVYWHQVAQCAAYGLHPPRPPEWLNIPWEPQKGRDPVRVIYIVGAVLAVLLWIVGCVWIWRIYHA